uniref:BZIP domain-containing protein n=1 Tax=Macrostomum lignano TaxID=282301 RepID=A0A1I8JJI5_9PLAT
MATSSGSSKEKSTESNELTSNLTPADAIATSSDWEIVDPAQPAASASQQQNNYSTNSSSSSVEVLRVSEADDTCEDNDADNNLDGGDQIDIGVELKEDEQQPVSSMQASSETVAASANLVVVGNEVQQQQQQFSGQAEQQRILKAIRLLQNSLPTSAEQQQQQQPLQSSPPTPPPEPEPARLRIIHRWLDYDEDGNEAERESPPESDIGLAAELPSAAAASAAVVAPPDGDVNSADYGHVLPAMLAEAARHRQRQYRHRPNEPVNGWLSVLCLVALAFAVGLGLGHFNGFSSGRDGRLLIGCRAWRADQAARSRALRRDLAACTRRYDNLELSVSELKTTLVQKEYVDKWESLYAESEEEKDALRLDELKARNAKLQVEIEQLRTSIPKHSKDLCGRLDRFLSNEYPAWFSALSNGTATAAKVGDGLLRGVNNASERLLRKLGNSPGGALMKKFTNATVKLFREQFGSLTGRLLRKLPKRYFDFSTAPSPPPAYSTENNDQKQPANDEAKEMKLAKDSIPTVPICVLSNGVNDANDDSGKARAALRWSLDGRAAARARERKSDAKKMKHHLKKLRQLRRGQKIADKDWYDRRL